MASSKQNKVLRVGLKRRASAGERLDMNMIAWVPQLLWRLNWALSTWFSPSRLFRQWWHAVGAEIFPNVVLPTRAEATLLLMRLMVGSYMLLLGCWALTNPAWSAAFRAQAEFWAAQHPVFLVTDILNFWVVPSSLWLALGWSIAHCWAGLAIASGLFLTPAVALLMFLHGSVVLAALPLDAATALTHAPILLLLPLLVIAHMGHRFGLDYWITSSEELAEMGLQSSFSRTQRTTRRRSTISTSRVKLKPQPDLDDANDDDDLDLTYLLNRYDDEEDDEDD